jgi:segregation and condensation protein A
MSTARYNLQLSNFTGPIDLLLHLIRVNRMDIFELDLHLITSQYLEALESAELASLENAYHFLLMASTLMEIKSKLLLPQEAAAEPGEPTGEEMKADLVRRLATYQNLKQVVDDLAQRMEQQQRLLYPEAPARLEQSLVYSLKDVSLYDLMTAFEEALERRQAVTRLAELEEDLSMEEVLAEVEQRILSNPKGITLAELLSGDGSLLRMIAAFIALLELIKEERVVFERQDGGFLLQPAPESAHSS